MDNSATSDLNKVTNDLWRAVYNRSRCGRTALIFLSVGYAEVARSTKTAKPLPTNRLNELHRLNDVIQLY